MSVTVIVNSEKLKMEILHLYFLSFPGLVSPTDFLQNCSLIVLQKVSSPLPSRKREIGNSIYLSKNLPHNRWLFLCVLAEAFWCFWMFLLLLAMFDIVFGIFVQFFQAKTNHIFINKQRWKQSVESILLPRIENHLKDCSVS